MSEQPEAMRLADLLNADAYWSPMLGEQAADELRRLHQHELAHIKWLEKTEWVQDTAHYSELGEHRADVIKQRFDRLHEVNQELLEALNAMLTHMGMDEDVWNKPTFDQARAAIAKGEKA